MQKWEYLVRDISIVRDYKYVDPIAACNYNIEKVLDELGKEGWELVSVATWSNTKGKISTSGPGVGSTYGDIETELSTKVFLKRPIA